MAHLSSSPRLLQALAGDRSDRPPVWFMRQAGRHLPEYRALRTQAPDFIAFCMNPEMAAEATLQPVRRYSLDAAIVFADILLIPQTLGQSVWFEAGEGPKLGCLPDIGGMDPTRAPGALAPVGETLRRVRGELPPELALIGFAGAPWTVATYMIEGGGSRDRAVARTMAYTNPDRVDALLEVLVEATALYLAMQVEAGAQVLQLFESWAEGLSEPLFRRLVIRPQQMLVARVRSLGVSVPLIGFPRGAGAMTLAYAREVEVQGVGLDTSTPLDLGREVQGHRTIQGALDPLLLRAGGLALTERVDELLRAWNDGPYIFNLGHGVLPDTPIAHVEQVLAQVTGR